MSLTKNSKCVCAFVCLAAAALSLAGGAEARTLAATGSTGLVAAYSFDQAGSTVADLSGNGNTGTVSGATWTSAGKYGGAYSFNGSTSYINVPDSASLDLTTGMTLEAWVKTTAADGGWHNVMMKQQTGMLVYALYAETGTTGPGAEVYTSGGSDYAAYRSYTLDTAVWKHVVATYDGATVRLWVNGFENASIAGGGAIATSSGVLRIGGNGVWGEYFSGTIDEVRIYNRALSQAEIQSDMTTAVAGTAPAPPPPAPDTTPPSTPTGLAVTGTSQTSISVSWSASSDNVGVAGYGLYRGGASTGSTTATSATFGGLACGTNYTLAVDAFDAAGNRSGQTSTTAATAACPPSTAAGVYVSPTGSDTNPCTQSAPCKSWDRGYRVAAPGAVVQIAGGSYGAQTLGVDSSKTSATQDVTLQPAAGSTVTLTGDLTILGSHVWVKGPIGAGAHNKLYVDLVGQPSHTHNVTVDGFDGEDFVVGPASFVTIRGGDFGPSVGCQDTGEYENKVSASSALPGVAPDHVTIEGNVLHDQTTANSVSCHNGGLNIVGGTFLTIRGNKFFKDMVYDIEFDDFTGSFPLSDVTIENNWFDAPTGALDGAGGCSSNVNCVGEADVQVKWNGVAAKSWLVRFNSFANGFAPEWGGAPPSYTSFRIVGNVGGNAWDGTKYMACRPAGKAGVTMGYNAWVGFDNLGSAPSSATCSTTDASLGPKVNYAMSALPYVGPSVTAPDFHLKAGTVAENLVTPTTSDYSLSTDIDGQARTPGAREAGSDEH